MSTPNRRILAAAVAAALTLAVAAGCTSAPQAAVATATEAVTHEQNDRVPIGASWTQHYFPSTGGVELHADVLLPEGLAPGEKVPVVLSAGGYFGHSGKLAVEGLPHTGPPRSPGPPARSACTASPRTPSPRWSAAT